MIHTDDNFLCAIEADPRELTLRFAYADWLTEHDDPRGELVRVEEEMRALPVFDDRFWALKPRRNELRVRAGSEWCARMRYGTECEPVFTHGIPEGCRERWRLIREFTERWHRVPMPDVGGRQAEIADAELRVGRPLPPSVREWLAFACDIAAEPGYTGELRFTHLHPVPAAGALSLRLFPDPTDHFGDSLSAVLLGDLNRLDPSVYLFHSELDEDHNHSFVRSNGKPQAPSVTAFALAHVVDLVPGSGGGFAVTLDQLTDLYRHLKSSFASHCILGECEWDEADNLLVQVEPVPEQRGTFRVTVNAAAAIRKEQVPDFIWRYARLGENPDGIFASQGRNRIN